MAIAAVSVPWPAAALRELQSVYGGVGRAYFVDDDPSRVCCVSTWGLWLGISLYILTP